MTTYDAISSLPPVNAVDPQKVEELKASMLADGWQGAPILYTELGLITGSHRKAALDSIDAAWDTLADSQKDVAANLLNSDIALDVTDIINAYCEENEITWDDIDFSSLGKIFEGTEVEQYKDEIAEW
jgi:hypothetical protein